MFKPRCSHRVATLAEWPISPVECISGRIVTSVLDTDCRRFESPVLILQPIDRPIYDSNCCPTLKGSEGGCRLPQWGQDLSVHTRAAG